MHARALIFTLLIGTLIGASAIVSHAVASGGPPSISPANSSIALPAIVGGFHLARQISGDPQYGEIVGTYLTPDADPVQLDVFVQSPAAHNSTYCLIVAGAGLDSQKLVQAESRSAPAVFDIAIVSDRGAVSLVASTECRSYGCDEQEILVHGFSMPRLSLVRFFGAYEIPVPVAITIRGPKGRGSAPDINARLTGEFNEFVAGLDLTPMMRLAGARSSQQR